jgi:hypothetical protein
VFENGVLWKIFGYKREEVAGDWRRLHIEELCNLYVSPNSVRVIKSRRMKWAGHVEQIKEINYTKFLLGNLKRKDHFEDLGVIG